MSGIDSRIVIVGLPAIGQQTGADLSELVWVTQAFLLATTISLPLIGRISDIVGRVKIYTIGFLIFTVGSALAAISFSPYELIGSRVVQGTGSAMLIANSVAILTDATPRNQLGTILGMNQISFNVGSVAGLTLSGVLLAIADWRSLFYINIPIGIFGTIWARAKLREISVKDPVRKMDWLGFLTFSSALALLLLAITFLSYGLSDIVTSVGLLGAGLVLLIFFIVLELRLDAPLLDFKLFKIREFAAGNLTQTLYALVLGGVILVLSFYLQIVLGESAFAAGLSIVPFNVAFVLVGPLSGRLSDKYGPRILASLGLAISTLGYTILSASKISSMSYEELAVILTLLGVGGGMFTSPNFSSIMRSVPPHRRGVGSGFTTTTFNAAMTASYGIVILLVSIAIPYSTFSAIIGGGGHVVLTTITGNEMLSGFKIAMFVLAVINAVAIIPSVLRGNGKIIEGDQLPGQIE